MSDNNNKEFQRVLIPMIQRILPNVIASELVNVQPMSAPQGSIFGSGSKKFISEESENKDFPYHARFDGWYVSEDFREEVLKWLSDTFHNKDNYGVLGNTVMFKREEDRTMFMLRWS